MWCVYVGKGGGYGIMKKYKAKGRGYGINNKLLQPLMCMWKFLKLIRLKKRFD